MSKEKVTRCQFHQRSMSIKAVRRTLMKLSSGVNFINVLRTNFSFKRRFSSYVLALSKNSRV